MKYVIGNWKSNKTTKDALLWLADFSALYNPTSTVKAILAPSFLQIAPMFEVIHKLSMQLELAGQDLSSFGDGAYTGEVCASQLAEYVKFSFIGHSERRINLEETDDMLSLKVKQAKANNIEPIFCVQSPKTPIPSGVAMILYEPIEAIGSGRADSPIHANETLSQIKKQHSNVQIGIYGGSVKPDNVMEIISQPDIDGVGVGGASLKPYLFAEIIKNVSKI